MFASGNEGKQEKQVRQLQSQELSLLIISHISFRDCCVHTFFRQPFSKKL